MTSAFVPELESEQYSQLSERTWLLNYYIPGVAQNLDGDEVGSLYTCSAPVFSRYD